MNSTSRKRPLAETYDERLRKKISKLGSLPVSEGKPLYQRDVKGHFGCVNSVEFSHNQDLLASGGDDTRVLLWSVSDMLGDDIPKPLAQMETKHLANIFAYAFSNDDQMLYSGGNDGFAMLHNLETKQKIRAWHAHGPVYNLSCSAIDNHVVAASRECGEVSFYDLRNKDGDSSISIKMKSLTSVYSGQFNPEIPHIFVVCTDNEGLALYDTRNLKTKLLDMQRMAEKCMYAEFNSTGQRIAVNPFKESPLVIDLVDNRMIRLKDDRYKSVHTIKSVIFAEDDVVMIGSDNFDIYSWKIPQKTEHVEVDGIEVFEKIEEATAVLKGHRSIVNHVRYNNKLHVLASCGIEKIIKLWSPMEMRNSTTTPNLRPISRHRNGMLMRDIFEDDRQEAEDQIEEDISMLRYFDRLILSNESEDSDEDEEGRIFGSSGDESVTGGEARRFSFIDQLLNGLRLEYLHDYGGQDADGETGSSDDSFDEEEGNGEVDENDDNDDNEMAFIRRLNSPSASRDRHIRYWDIVEDEREEAALNALAQGDVTAPSPNLITEAIEAQETATNENPEVPVLISEWPPAPLGERSNEVGHSSGRVDGEFAEVLFKE